MTQQKTPKLFKNFRGLLAFNPFLSYNLGDTIKKTTRGGLKMYQTARANQTVSRGYEVLFQHPCTCYRNVQDTETVISCVPLHFTTSLLFCQSF